VNSEEFERLLRQAQDDPSAVDALRGVTSIEGRPVELDAVLDAGSPDLLDQRLAELADLTGSDIATPGDPSAARIEADDILSGDAFTESEIPKPLEGLVEWLSERVSWVFDRLGPIGDSSLGRWGLLAAVAFFSVACIGVLVRRRLVGRNVRAQPEILGEEFVGMDATDVDARARAAEAEGDLTEALRLHFVAGIIRLDRAEIIDARPATTMHELRAQVDQAPFDTLAAGFERAVYGEIAPSADELSEVRHLWGHVLAADAATVAG